MEKYKCPKCGRESESEDGHFCLGHIDNYKYIPVAELREWCEARINKEGENLFIIRQQFMPTNDDILFESKTIGSIDALKDLLARFCNGGGGEN
jgi:hypothetical protein